MNIQPIRLLKGMHEDTASTGQGCFMNVIAYLNGESQITDTSPCVCVTVRLLAINLNDFGTEEQRQRLLPFVLRAMGSATQDAKVLDARVARLRKYGEECAELMRNASAYAYANADAYADADAVRASLFDAGLRFLDDVLPAAEQVSPVVAERCETLVKLQAA